MSGQYHVHVGFVEKRQVSFMPPGTGVPAHIKHRDVQKHDFPRGLAFPEILLGESELFIRTLLEVKVECEHMDWAQVERIPALGWRETEVGEVVDCVFFVVPDRRQHWDVIDDTRERLKKLTAP